jgi:hypothetical protein
MRDLPKEVLDFANKTGHEFVFQFCIEDIMYSSIYYKCKSCGINCLITEPYCGFELYYKITIRDNFSYLKTLSCKELQIKDILE